MNHTFLRLQLKHCPRVEGWFLLVNPADAEAELALHKSVTSSLFLQSIADPKKTSDPMLKARIEALGLHSPVRLGAAWIGTLHKLTREGAVVMNINGGMSPLEGWKIIARHDSDKLEWPVFYDDEIIRLHKWAEPNATHYYLKSSRGRIFDPVKFDSLDDATAQAAKFVTADRIVVEKPTRRPRQGD
jgi:hypothetical protein